jgi:PPOX class probable F420-dependent enzyme
MRRGLRVDELGDLLDRPLVAVLGTTRPDGGILLSPVWQEWCEGGFNLFSTSDDVKVRHLKADPRASIVVFESIPPYRGMEVRGTATLVRENATAVALRIMARYEDEDEPPPPDCVIVRLEPGVLRAWDFVDEF